MTAVLRERIGTIWRKAVQTARLAIGVPDYDVYVAHMRSHHPQAHVMNYTEFFNERQQKRYGNGSSRCC
jgi:uncharacterized short protein YbdD (DUF466 family)